MLCVACQCSTREDRLLNCSGQLIMQHSQGLSTFFNPADVRIAKLFARGKMLQGKSEIRRNRRNRSLQAGNSLFNVHASDSYVAPL